MIFRVYVYLPEGNLMSIRMVSVQMVWDWLPITDRLLGSAQAIHPAIHPPRHALVTPMKPKKAEDGSQGCMALG